MSIQNPDSTLSGGTRRLPEVGGGSLCGEREFYTDISSETKSCSKQSWYSTLMDCFLFVQFCSTFRPQKMQIQHWGGGAAKGAQSKYIQHQLILMFPSEFGHTSNHSTEMGFASFLSGGFITAIVLNPPERKLAKRTSVNCITNVQSCAS